MSRRWSWPPLSWCGYLWRTWPASRLTSASAAAILADHSRVGEAAEVDRPEHPEDVVDLEDRVAGAEGVLEDALDLAVVGLELATLEGRDVVAVDGDRAAR